MRRNKQKGISLFLLLVFVVVAAFGVGYFYSGRQLEVDAVIQSVLANKSTRVVQETSTGLDFPWPPEIGQPFPDIELFSTTGEMVKLSDFKGKVILLEPVGMTCPACNAFSGAGEKGGYQGISAQQNLPPIETLLPEYANHAELGDDRLVFVQLMLYDLQYNAPTIEDSRNWAEHFGLDDRDNVYLLVGDQRYINQASYDMIPGFFLIDKDFILRSDSTGHQPKHNLYTELLPQLSVLLQSVDFEQTAAVTDANNELTDLLANDSFPERLYEQLGMTVPVDKAYRSIPHKQTTFNPAVAKMSEQDKMYLHKLFSIVDIAIIERVQTLLWYRTGGRRGENKQNYQQILAELDQLDVPDYLIQPHQLIKQAIQEQAQYFINLEGTTDFRFSARDSSVQSAHVKLINAYNQLMARFPQENKHNKTAFYDHLCALDFI